MALFQGQATRVIVREPEEIKVEKILTPKTDAPEANGRHHIPPHSFYVRLTPNRQRVVST
jgi:hypothetical protein